MTKLMPCIKDESPEEFLEIFHSHLMREDVKRFTVCKDGKEVVYVKQVEGEPSIHPEIIRCKDCTWCQDDTVHGKVFCSREGAMDRIELDSYCSYRERRTE